MAVYIEALDRMERCLGVATAVDICVTQFCPSVSCIRFGAEVMSAVGTRCFAGLPVVACVDVLSWLPMCGVVVLRWGADVTRLCVCL